MPSLRTASSIFVIISVANISALATSATLQRNTVNLPCNVRGGSISSAIEKASNSTIAPNPNNTTTPSFSIETSDNVEGSTRTGLDLDGEDVSATDKNRDCVDVSMSTATISVNDNDNDNDKKALKVLFLSADTGGGHRASAESLANQFQKHYPGTEYNLHDVWTPTNVYPYRTLVRSYKHLSANPRHWKLLYHISNTRPYEIMTDIHSKFMCYDHILKQLEQYDPDVVVSVHPTMNYVPERAIRKIAEKRGKYIPFFTVVTDFGSAHCTWFQRRVDKMYIASERIRRLAKRRGSVKDDKLVMSGLPIREDFAVQARNMGDRTSSKGKEYRRNVKEKLNLDPTKKVILLMGGGEGVGSLSQIANMLYVELKSKGVDASICVVCGRNEKLRDELANKDWDGIESEVTNSKKERKIRKFLKKLFTKKVDSEDMHGSSSLSQTQRLGNVNVIPLGFVTNMAEYMVASDVLVSKAGPGTIAEAAAVGLPVMITSFLPGQEAGNVDIVLDGNFGAFHKQPKMTAKVVTSWLLDDSKLDEMGRRSAAVGNPDAASNIVRDIGSITLEIMENNARDRMSE